MADAQTKAQPQFNYPTRTLAITGERVARMVQGTIRVSRLEQRLIQLSMSGSAPIRDAIRRASEDFDRAFNDLEAKLKLLESDLDSASRNGNQRTRGKGKPQGAPKQTLTRSTAGKDGSKPAQQVKKSDNAQPKAQEKGNGSTSEKGGKPAAQPAKQQAAPQEEKKPSPAATVPVSEEAPAPVPAALTSL